MARSPVSGSMALLCSEYLHSVIKGLGSGRIGLGQGFVARGGKGARA